MGTTSKRPFSGRARQHGLPSLRVRLRYKRFKLKDLKLEYQKLL